MRCQGLPHVPNNQTTANTMQWRGIGGKIHQEAKHPLGGFAVVGYVKMVRFNREREFRSSYVMPRREKFPYHTCHAVRLAYGSEPGQGDRRASKPRRQEKARKAICFYSNFPSTHILGYLHWGCPACAHSKPGATGNDIR